MKKLVVSLAALGLVGVAPVQAHEPVDGLRCSARILRVTQQDDTNVVRTRVSVANTSESDTWKSPVLVAYLLDSGDRVGKVRLAASRLKPSEVETQWNVREVGADVDEIVVEHCHS